MGRGSRKVDGSCPGTPPPSTQSQRRSELSGGGSYSLYRSPTRTPAPVSSSIGSPRRSTPRFSMSNAVNFGVPFSSQSSSATGGVGSGGTSSQRYGGTSWSPLNGKQQRAVGRSSGHGYLPLTTQSGPWNTVLSMARMGSMTNTVTTAESAGGSVVS